MSRLYREFLSTRLSGESSLEKIWLDENTPPTLWIRARDGDTVCVPASLLPTLREIAVKAEKLAQASVARKGAAAG